MPYSDVVMADAPVGYWRLADLTDSSGNGLALTQGGTVTDVPSLLASDPANGAKRFFTDYQVDRLTHADDPLLRLTSAFSMEAWVKPAFVDRFQILQKFQSYSLYLRTDGKFRAEVYTSSGFYGAESTTIATSSGVYHVVGTFDGSNVRLYVNGALEATTPTPGTPLNNTNQFCLGADPGNAGGWWGVIDEPAVYHTVLTPARVLARYNAGVGVGGVVDGAVSLLGAGALTVAPRRRRHAVASLLGAGALTAAALRRRAAAAALTGVGVLHVVASPSPPKNIALPSLSGTPEVGSTLTCTVGAWGGEAPFTFARQWRRNGFVIPGATASSYLLTGGDEGTSVHCSVTATNAGGVTTAQSAAVAVVAAPPPPVIPATGVGGQPNVAGWMEAQDRLRRMLGTTVEFLIPPTLTAEDYPPGTSLDPETGFPFDPTVEIVSQEAAERIEVVASVVHRPIDTDVRDAALDMPVGLVPSSNAALIISLEDRDRTEGATEVEIWGERYRITEWRRDGLTVQNRWIVFTQER
jgi:hypothetical protein